MRPYDQYKEAENASYTISLKDNYWAYGVIASVLVSLSLMLKVSGYPAPFRILAIVIIIGGIIIGWMGASFAGIFLVAVPLYILYEFMNHVPALFSVLCLAGAAYLLYRAVREQKNPEKLLEKKRSNTLYPLGK